MGRRVAVEDGHTLAAHGTLKLRHIIIYMALDAHIGVLFQAIIAFELALEHRRHGVVFLHGGQQSVKIHGLVLGEIDGRGDGLEERGTRVKMVVATLVNHLEARLAQHVERVIEVAHGGPEHLSQFVGGMVLAVGHRLDEVEPFGHG